MVGIIKIITGLGLSIMKIKYMFQSMSAIGNPTPESVNTDE